MIDIIYDKIDWASHVVSTLFGDWLLLEHKKIQDKLKCEDVFDLLDVSQTYYAQQIFTGRFQLALKLVLSSWTSRIWTLFGVCLQ